MFAAVLLAALHLTGHSTEARAQSGATNSRVFRWTAPGDDGSVGRAARYEFRFSTLAVADSTDSASFAAWWSASTAVPASAMPAPSAAGAVESAVVSGLAYGTEYYFVIRSVDEAQNWSSYSNVARVTLAPCDAPASAPEPPGLQTDSLGVLLSWTTPQDPLAASVEIYRGPSPTRLALLERRSVGETSYHDGTVRSGTTYYYALAWAASCGTGVVGNASSITVSAPPAPAALATPKNTLRVYPNPATGPLTLRFQIGGTQPQAVRVRLYDVAGHWVADLADGTFSAGETQLTWNRLTRGGDAAAPGYYEALGTIGSTRVRERLVLLP